MTLPSARSEQPSPRRTDADLEKGSRAETASVTMYNCERETRLFDFAGGTAAAYVCRCPGKLTNNEDSLGAIAVGPSRGVLAIADGVGGERWGDRASRAAIEAISHSLAIMPPGDDSRPAILNGMELANQKVLALGVGAASTLSLVEICGHVIRPYHVGDSMMMLVGSRGRIKWQTVPHSPVGYAVEAGILNEHDAIHHEDRHLVSNIVGADNMRIEIGPRLTMAARDTLIVASDGLFDNLHLPEIVELIRKGPLKRVVKQLSDQLTMRMATRETNSEAPPRFPSKPDDTSVLLFRRGA